MLLSYENITYDTENGYQLNDLLHEILTSMSDPDIVALWNEFCQDQGYIEESIYSMDFLEEYLTMTGKTAYDVITGNVIDSDCFCYQEDWFIESIWGLRSSNSAWDLVSFEDEGFRAYFEELLLDNPEKYDCEEVEEEDEEED